MLLTGRTKTEITIETPKGPSYTARLLDIRRGEKRVSCAVEKDGGDDPDITTGAHIYAEVSLLEDGEGNIVIDGGIGVGRVTRPGLDQPVGSAAINRMPREMIEREVRQICEMTDYPGSLRVEICVPEGVRLAEKTFNPRLGIVGGISILGTSGIVEPMSSRAVIDTIFVELRQRREEGFDHVVVSPGNYGLEFVRETYGYDLDKSIKCSNYIGETLDMALELGFSRLLLAGHVGKLIKVAGGIMNTHSREADCRMELLAAFAAREGLENELLNHILGCAVTEEALGLIRDAGKLQPVMDRAMERICYYLQRRVKGQMRTDCIVYANAFGELARSREVEQWFTLLGQEQARQT